MDKYNGRWLPKRYCQKFYEKQGMRNEKRGRWKPGEKDNRILSRGTVRLSIRVVW
jgi:hypothetical protein